MFGKTPPQNNRTQLSDGNEQKCTIVNYHLAKTLQKIQVGLEMTFAILKMLGVTNLTTLDVHFTSSALLWQNITKFQGNVGPVS